MVKLEIGKYYKCNDRGDVFVGMYIGQNHDTSCVVCGKGHKCRAFNIYYSDDGYETWAFGDNHMPEIICQVPEK